MLAKIRYGGRVQGCATRLAFQNNARMLRTWNSSFRHHVRYCTPRFVGLDPESNRGTLNGAHLSSYEVLRGRAGCDPIVTLNCMSFVNLIL